MKKKNHTRKKLPATRKRRGSPQRTREELDALHAATNPVPQHAKEETRELPKWSKLAMARRIFYGETHKEAAAHHGFSESSLKSLANSPAGKKWRASLEAIADDPVKCAEAMLRANATGVMFDMFWALDAARGAGDYEAVGLMTRDLMDRIPETRKQSQASNNAGAGPTLVINFPSDSLAPVQIESSHTAAASEEAAEADYEIMPDD